MAVSKRLRFEVMRRDGHACRYCGASAPYVKLTIDHVTPISLGGRDGPENLVTACGPCNTGKSSIAPDAPLVANVSDDALRWARAMAQASDLAEAAQAKQHELVAMFDSAWRAFFDNKDATAEQLAQAKRADFYRDASWRQSVARFLAGGLTLVDLWGLTDDVMARAYIENGRIWRYFCGACWKLLRERQETARALIDSGEV
jgi:hypothetical protein